MVWFPNIKGENPNAIRFEKTLVKKNYLTKDKRIDGEIIDDTRTNFYYSHSYQSLTGEPKQYAWERPPEYDTPEDALKFYLPKITEDETVDDIMLALENDFPLSTLVRVYT